MESSAGVAERGGAPVPVGGRTGRRDGRPLRRGEDAHAAEPDRGLGASGLLAHARDYLALTKPRIISLLLWTTVATMLVARPEGLALSTVLWTCLGGYLAAGGAGAKGAISAAGPERKPGPPCCRSAKTAKRGSSKARQRVAPADH